MERGAVSGDATGAGSPLSGTTEASWGPGASGAAAPRAAAGGAGATTAGAAPARPAPAAAGAAAAAAAAAAAHAAALDAGSVDSEDEDEPMLKYIRLGGSLSSIMKSESISAMDVHKDFLVIGTDAGNVILVDMAANERRRWPAHRGRVNDVRVDIAGQNIASCSEDGHVIISGFSGDPVVYDHHRPVLTVALDPQFAAKTFKRPFACGGVSGKFVVIRKAPIFGLSDRVVSEGEGAVRALAWRGNLIAWANDAGVKVYDAEREVRITYIAKPDGAVAPAACPPRLAWEDDATLLIGWYDVVKIVHIIETVSATAERAVTRSATVVSNFSTGYYICGIVPFGGELALLSYDPPTRDGEELAHHQPELHIVQREDGLELCCDALPVSNYEELLPPDYALHCDHERLVGDSSLPLVFITTPKEVVLAKPRGLDDHIEWFIQKARFEDAVALAEANVAAVAPARRVELADKYLRHLLAGGHVREAAALCPRLLGGNGELWEQWVDVFFVSYGAVGRDAIAAVLPTASPRLSQGSYERVLEHYMLTDPAQLLHCLRKWPAPERRGNDGAVPPSSIYDTRRVMARLEALIRERGSSAFDSRLYDALAELCVLIGDHQRALSVHLDQRGRGGNVSTAFALIREHDMIADVEDKALSLMELDEEAAVALLAGSIDRIPIDDVLKQLRAHGRLQCKYLQGVWRQNADAFNGGDHTATHEMLAALLVSFDQEQLLPFLRYSHNIENWDKLLRMCEARTPQLCREMVFILERLDRASDAVVVLMDKLGDVRGAIEFIGRHGDESLWSLLVRRACVSDVSLGKLLDCVPDSTIDPLTIVKEIPLQMKIPRLKERLTRIIQDHRTDFRLHESCVKVIKADCVQLMRRLNRAQLRAVAMPVGKVSCALCGDRLAVRPRLEEPPRSREEEGGDGQARVIVFFCSHAYHQACLQHEGRAFKARAEHADRRRSRVHASFSERFGSSPLPGGGDGTRLDEALERAAAGARTPGSYGGGGGGRESRAHSTGEASLRFYCILCASEAHDESG